MTEATLTKPKTSVFEDFFRRMQSIKSMFSMIFDDPEDIRSRKYEFPEGEVKFNKPVRTKYLVFRNYDDVTFLISDTDFKINGLKIIPGGSIFYVNLLGHDHEIHVNSYAETFALILLTGAYKTLIDDSEYSSEEIEDFVKSTIYNIKAIVDQRIERHVNVKNISRYYAGEWPTNITYLVEWRPREDLLFGGVEMEHFKDHLKLILLVRDFRNTYYMSIGKKDREDEKFWITSNTFVELPLFRKLLNRLPKLEEVAKTYLEAYKLAYLGVKAHSV